LELFSLLQKRSKPFYFFLLVLGLVNSVWASALLLFINNKTSGTPLPFMNEYDWALYLGLIVVSFVVARYFQLYMIRLTYDLGNELGLSIFDKLRFTDYEDYLRLGEDKVRAVLTDVTTLQRFPQAFIECFNAAVMVVIGIGYLLWINPMGALIIVLFLVVLAAIYFVRNVSIQKDLSKARDMNEVYQQNVNDFLRGFKEVKMSMQRSDNLFEKHITENRNKVKDLTVRTLSRHLVNELMGNYTFYLVIGLILFLLPVLFQMSQQMNVSFIVTLLYLMGPISMLVSEIHEFTKMAIAVERIGEFNQQINAAKGIEVGHGDTTPINETFESLEFENVTYEYYDEKKAQTFRLQPFPDRRQRQWQKHFYPLADGLVLTEIRDDLFERVRRHTRQLSLLPQSAILHFYRQLPF
jgi:putative ATP-binding cassette transporter